METWDDMPIEETAMRYLELHPSAIANNFWCKLMEKIKMELEK